MTKEAGDEEVIILGSRWPACVWPSLRLPTDVCIHIISLRVRSISSLTPSAPDLKLLWSPVFPLSEAAVALAPHQWQMCLHGGERETATTRGAILCWAGTQTGLRLAPPPPSLVIDDPQQQRSTIVSAANQNRRNMSYFKEIMRGLNGNVKMIIRGKNGRNYNIRPNWIENHGWSYVTLI